MNSIPCRIENGQPVFYSGTLSRFVEGKEGKTCDLVIREEKRTGRQNRAMHKWFQLVADALNESGNNVQLVLKEKVDIDWTASLVKEVLWRPAQKVILKKESTTELKKVELDPILEHLNRHLGEKFHIEYIPLPSYESEEEYVEATTADDLQDKVYN